MYLSKNQSQMAKITTPIFGLAWLIAIFAACLPLSLAAQDQPAAAAPAASAAPSGGIATPKDMLEMGIHTGYFFIAGDVKQEFGYGYGLHFRKATDYMFSLRLDLMGGQASGKNPVTNIAREYELSWYSATALGVFSLNNFRFDRVNRRFNYFAMVGGGGNYYTSDFSSAGSDGNPRMGVIEREIAPHATVGAGLAVRLGKKVNVAIESQGFVLFGKRADQLDGITKEDGVRSAFTDIPVYTSLRINFNLGNSSNRSEPLYWCNPLEGVMKDLEAVKKRQDEALADTDNDGIIDAIDQEPDTPADVPVDTKGRTLDSDKDGIADYKDKEPYYPPRTGETVNEDGVVINPIGGPGGSGGGVTEARVQEMIDAALAKYGITEQRRAVADFFLPMIHFGTDNATIKYSDYGTLAGIGRLMKNDESMRIVVIGHADQTGAENYNDLISYQRAKNVVDHLVNQYGIGRGRLVLQWKGSKESLVPQSASFMNRRVEFSVARSTDIEMDPPAGGTTTPDGY